MIHIHASGVLLSAPQSRTSAKGATYTTGMLKSTSKDGDAVVSFICLSESEQQALLDLAAGDALTVAGLGKLTQWTAKDGSERHGLSVVVDRLLPHQPGKAKPAARAEPSPLPVNASRSLSSMTTCRFDRSRYSGRKSVPGVIRAPVPYPGQFLKNRYLCRNSA